MFINLPVCWDCKYTVYFIISQQTTTFFCFFYYPSKKLHNLHEQEPNHFRAQYQ